LIKSCERSESKKILLHWQDPGNTRITY